ncbi:hypothetical protein Q1695_001699 [Nippostrongylus brasiliensis]|nr:hypothetical protein Q1695_001699 [Nippostrongylus brasiliensis]
MWGIRSQLLMALKLYPQLIEELLPFEELDAPDLYYQYYSNGNEKTGSLIPFSMRLIHAEVLRFTPFPWKAVERIERLEAGVKKAINCAALCLLYNGKANEAIKVYGQLIQKSSEPLYINLKAISELACSTVEKSELLNDFVKKRIA